VSELEVEVWWPVSMWQRGGVVWVVALVVCGVAAGLAVETVVAVVFVVAGGVVVVVLAELAGAVVALVVLRRPRGWHRSQSRNRDRISRCPGQSYDSQDRCEQRS